jgi:hypothetical protein
MSASMCNTVKRGPRECLNTGMCLMPVSMREAVKEWCGAVMS